jgi:biopolymer transport protein ExbD
MAAPKKRRIPVTVDMTPMVDIAFLLLIFFMSTTQFKKPEEVEVQIPTSHSAFKLPETGMIVITITKNSEIYMTMDDAALDYANQLSEIKPGSRMAHGKLFNTADIPPIIHQLQIKRLVNRVVLKADRATSYQTIESVMETLQKNDLNIVNLVTDLVEERAAKKSIEGETGGTGGEPGK